MDASTIISDFGGPGALAEKLGTSRTAPYNWRHDGIPARYWPQIARLAAAAENTKHITLEALEAQAKRRAEVV